MVASIYPRFSLPINLGLLKCYELKVKLLPQPIHKILSAVGPGKYPKLINVGPMSIPESRVYVEASLRNWLVYKLAS